MAPEPEPIGLQQLDRILAFLPIFARPGYSFGAWRMVRWVIPSYEASPEVGAFIATLHREGFITPFDWGGWAEEAQRYTAGGAVALAGADLTDLRRLMTAYVRADRFTAGTLAGLFESGQITAVLHRLKQIRDELAAENLLIE